MNQRPASTIHFLVLNCTHLAGMMNFFKLVISGQIILWLEGFVSRYRLLLYAGLCCYTAIALFKLIPNRGMGPSWSVPYFSGAANLETGKGWRFLPCEADSIKQASGMDFYTYRFKKGDDQNLRTYRYNASGYVYFIYLSQKIFPFVNEAGSVVILQLLLHTFCCLLLLQRLKKQLPKFVFLFGYACNPLILYVVTFPFYYFVQVISSFLVLVFYTNKRLSWWQVIPLFLAGCFFLHCRKTVFPLELLICGLFLFRRQFLNASVCLSLLLFFPVLWKNAGFISDRNTGPWHTVFIGVGAYPNPYPYLQTLSDNTGMDLFRTEKDSTISSSLEGKFVYDSSIQDAYLSFAREKYISILKERPLLLLRNAVLNFFQGYSAGHVSNFSFWLNVLISASGAVVFFFLLLRKEYFYLMAIGLSHISFSPFYPPIPVYMFGTYLLLVYAISKAITGKKQVDQA